MFLDILEVRIEKNKKIFRENGFANVVSDLCEKAYVSTKLLLEKKSSKTKQKTKN